MDSGTRIFVDKLKDVEPANAKSQRSMLTDKAE